MIYIFLFAQRIFLGEEGAKKTSYINSDGVAVHGIKAVYASKDMLQFSVNVFSQASISLNNDFTFKLINNRKVR